MRVLILLILLSSVVHADPLEWTPEQTAKFEAHMKDFKKLKIAHEEALKRGDPEALHREAVVKYYLEKAQRERDEKFAAENASVKRSTPHTPDCRGYIDSGTAVDGQIQIRCY